MECNSVRDLLALDPKTEDDLVQAHLGECEPCAAYRRQHQTLDVVLRAEMRWEAPAALTAQLLALVGTPAVVAQPAPARARPRGWYVTAVYGLTAAVVALSLLIAVQLVGALADQVSLGAAITQLLALPGQGLLYLTQAIPQSRFVLDFMQRVYEQLLWLLLVAVLWAALDKWSIPISFGRPRQQAS